MPMTKITWSDTKVKKYIFKKWGGVGGEEKQRKKEKWELKKKYLIL